MTLALQIAPKLAQSFPALIRLRNQKIRIAVDPGKSGALALLDGPTLLDVKDMPIRTEYGRMKLHYKNGIPYEKPEEFHFISASEVYEIFWNWSKEHIVDEAVFEDTNVNFDENMSKHACMVLGRGFGIIEGAAAAVGLMAPDSLKTVLPAVWKRKLGVTSDKKTSLSLAKELWPNFATSHFKRAKDDGRAEASLIGYYAHIAELH